DVGGNGRRSLPLRRNVARENSGRIKGQAENKRTDDAAPQPARANPGEHLHKAPLLSLPLRMNFIQCDTREGPKSSSAQFVSLVRHSAKSRLSNCCLGCGSMATRHLLWESIQNWPGTSAAPSAREARTRARRGSICS